MPGRGIAGSHGWACQGYKELEQWASSSTRTCRLSSRRTRAGIGARTCRPALARDGLHPCLSVNPPELKRSRIKEFGLVGQEVGPGTDRESATASAVET